VLPFPYRASIVLTVGFVILLGVLGIVFLGNNIMRLHGQNLAWSHGFPWARFLTQFLPIGDTSLRKCIG
jgi:hypothetical protein